MGCTTILVGKNASYDGSPLVARNEDSPAGEFTAKKVQVVLPADQPRQYTSVLAKLTIDLPDNPLQYSSVPNALLVEGIWGEAGINSANVAMSATETLTTNSRVMGADPLIDPVDAKGTPGDAAYQAAQPGGIGEEDFLTIVLPYIKTAREGVLRLGSLLAEFGTSELNGVAFSDADEIWWLETVGGHHWIAKRVPDDEYVTMPNQLGIDDFDIDDALSSGVNHLASADLREFIADNFLDLTLTGPFNPRHAFGSASDADHVYNTPRAWYMQRVLNPGSDDFAGPAPRLTPTSDDIPWSRKPERKLTIEDVKYVLSSHYQGTEFDPYSELGTAATRGMFRPIGINRHSQLSLLQVRKYRPESSRSLQWVAYASNPFNTLVPFYTNVDAIPDYLGDTTARVTSENFYWQSRIIAALADAHFNSAAPDIERYQEDAVAAGYAVVAKTDKLIAEKNLTEESAVKRVLEDANTEIAQRVRKLTDDLLGKILFIASEGMHNKFSRSDG